MTKRDIYSLALKIMGVWISIEGFVYLPGMYVVGRIQTNPQIELSPTIISVLVMMSPLLMILMGILLWFLSDRISASVQDDVIISLPGWLTNKNTALKFALEIIGFLLLARHLPFLIYSIYAILRDQFAPNGSSSFSLSFPSQQAQVVGALLSVVIGFYLIFGCKRFRLSMKGESNDNE